ncbi:Aste57867_20547 [Aphanomyces stellatus]|uniref:3-dehydroquinate dehydratase n=1 Tax=Aphanomyces stellatus TaxID=120398 RepID=A0A485LGP6_9STRA|nr:hypothetical protein As57867_020480 [Aphanomyces stellatus]VFT97232.1 Aste57867_20547 [Aphanomyces stellatus]
MKKPTPYQPKHDLKYGLEVVRTDDDGDVTLRCLFCVHEGRDEVEVGPHSDRKRKQRSTIKFFKKPFTPHKYRSHHEGQHKESWALYQHLSVEEKQNYFTEKREDIRAAASAASASAPRLAEHLSFSPSDYPYAPSMMPWQPQGHMLPQAAPKARSRRRDPLVLVLNGPCSLVDGHVSGTTVLWTVLYAELARQASAFGLTLAYDNSNEEGVVVDRLLNCPVQSTVILNCGDLAHTYPAIQKAIDLSPAIIYLLNERPHAASTHVRQLSGFGAFAYELALQAVGAAMNRHPSSSTIV